MERIAACFAASRYFSDKAELEQVYGELCTGLQSIATDCRLIVDGQGVDELPEQKDGLLVVVPMSGAVQKDILRATERFGAGGGLWGLYSRQLR